MKTPRIPQHFITDCIYSGERDASLTIFAMTSSRWPLKKHIQFSQLLELQLFARHIVLLVALAEAVSFPS